MDSSPSARAGSAIADRASAKAKGEPKHYRSKAWCGAEEQYAADYASGPEGRVDSIAHAARLKPCPFKTTPNRTPHGDETEEDPHGKSERETGYCAAAFLSTSIM